jgi:NAD(P)-dependent dehydrogenase (short-subunit alcohol dehydrogenase family)
MLGSTTCNTFNGRLCSCPGLVDTELFAPFPADFRAELFKSTLDKLLVGHIGLPDEVAEAYIFAMKVSELSRMYRAGSTHSSRSAHT